MLHKKKVLAVAIAATAGLSGLAAAQSSNVVLYGKFYPELIVGQGKGGNTSTTGLATLVNPATGPSDTPTIFSESAANSRIGIRGEEQLGGDLKAIFQLESTVPVDAGNGTLASRDTFVGLSSERWGAVKLGNFDTVYKNLGDTLSFLGVSSGNFVSNSNILSKSALGTNSAASFHLRRANSVQYESPDFFHGFGFLAQYSPDENKTSTRNADLFSGGVKYENGPLYAALAYEKHRDLFGGSRNVRAAFSNFNDQNARSKDQAARGTLRYQIGELTLEGDAARIEYEETGGQNGRFNHYKRNSFLVSGDYRWNAWRFAASYVWGEKGTCDLNGALACSTEGLKGSQVSLGASYSLSKRTQIFFLAAKLSNSSSARYNNADWLSDVQPGQDISQVALGISHSF